MTKNTTLPESGAREAPFVVRAGVLSARGDLYWESLEAFDAACASVLAARGQRIELDLTAANFISSSFLGCLGALVVRAARLKKRITLKVTVDIGWLFDIMGPQRNVDVEIC